LTNPSRRERCAACNRPRGRLRSRANPASVMLVKDRPHSPKEDIVIDYVNPHKNPFDVVCIAPEKSSRYKGWPVPGVTNDHWQYVGDNRGSNDGQIHGYLRKEKVEGSVKFSGLDLDPGIYQVQLRLFVSGTWTNVVAQCELVIGTSSKFERSTGLYINTKESHQNINNPKDEFPAKRKHRALVGLQNIGNTCYMNAAVQCLATLTPMMDEFLSRAPGPEPPPPIHYFPKKDGTNSFRLPLDSPKPKKSPPKLPSPRVELKDGEWRCLFCTLKNEKGAIRCKLCGKLAGKKVREQVRKDTKEYQGPRIEAKVDTEYQIHVRFQDPQSRPYTVVCVVASSIPKFGEGLWPIPGWNTPGRNWFYTDLTGDQGVTGREKGELKFDGKEFGGGSFQVQLRYYANGNWTTIEAYKDVTISDLPEKVKGGRRVKVVKQQDSGNIATESPNVKAPNRNGKMSLEVDTKTSKIRSLEKIIVSPKSSSPRKRLKPGVLSDEFTRLMQNLNSIDVDGKYICPEYLKSIFDFLRPEFKGKQQHDCQEFTQALLDELNRDMRRIDRNKTKRRRRKSGISTGKTRKRKTRVMRTDRPSIRAQHMMQAIRRPLGSVISEMFFGMLENRIQCQSCNNRSTVYSTFSTISLDIIRNNHNFGNSGSWRKRSRVRTRTRASSSSSVPSGKKNRSRGEDTDEEETEEPKTLHQCFQDFTKEERLCGANAYYCSKCDSRGVALKKMMFYHLPPVLIIHLKRFTIDGSGKAESRITFPNDLDLSKYCLRLTGIFSVE